MEKKIADQEKFDRTQEVMNDKIKLIAEFIKKGMVKQAKIEIKALKAYLDFELSSAVSKLNNESK